MINSPSLSLTSATMVNPSARNGASGSSVNKNFGSYMEQASESRSSQQKQSGPSEKQPLSQKDSPAPERASGSDDRVERSNTAQRTQTDSAASDKVAKQQAENEASPSKQDATVSETKEAAKQSSEAAKQSADSETESAGRGKELQTEGQKIADEASNEASVVDDAALEAESAEQMAAEEATEQNSSSEAQSTQVEENDLLKADADKVNSDVSEADQTLNTGQNDSVNSEADTSVSHPSDQTTASVDSETDAVEQQNTVSIDSETADVEQQITAEQNVGDDVTPDNTTAATVESDASVEAAVNATTEAQAEGAAVASVASDLKGDAAKTTGVGNVESRAQVDTAVTASLSNKMDDKAQGANLRWVMDQMSQTAEKTTLAQTFAKMNAESAAQMGDDNTLLDSDLLANDELLNALSNQSSAKKSLEQLMTSLNGQLQNTLGQNASANLAASTQTATANRGDAPSQGPQLTMQTMPNSTAWTAEMTTKVSWVAREGFKTAHIQLDPPELGSLTVKVSMDQDSNTQVSFVASSAQAKDALEGQMQRLRDMLQQQGVDVESVDVEVSQGNDQSAGQEQLASERRGSGEMNGLDELGDDELLENVSHISHTDRGIDFYV